MPAGFTIDYRAEELSGLVRSLERLGASVEVIDRKLWDIADKGLAEPIRRRTPTRSGRLRRSIRTEVARGASKASGARVGGSEVRVVQDKDVAVYGPIVHFGWATRGLQKLAAKVRATNARGKVTAQASRAAFREQVVGAGFSRRAADKAFKTRQARRIKGSDRMVGAVRGGPIAPNPWMYRTRDDRRDAVTERYEREAVAVVRLFELDGAAA